jgi:hypothetical protein
MDYFNKYSMLNEGLTESDYISENTLLFSAVYILLLKENGKPYKASLDAFKAYLEVCKQRKGLYDQLPVRSGGKDDSMSHDQLTAIIRISKEFDLGIHEDIWEEIKRQHFKYSNIHPDTFLNFEDGWHHPMHIMYYGIVCGNPLWYITYPIVMLLSVISCLAPQESTSGKQICWVKFKGLFPVMHKICTWCVNIKNGNWKSMFSIYYKDSEHPINKEF